MKEQEKNPTRKTLVIRRGREYAKSRKQPRTESIRRGFFHPHVEDQTNEPTASPPLCKKGEDFYVAFAILPPFFPMCVALSRGCYSQHGLIYSRRFIPSARRRVIHSPRFSIYAASRILFRDFAFCHVKFEYMTKTRGGPGQECYFRAQFDSCTWDFLPRKRMPQTTLRYDE